MLVLDALHGEMTLRGAVAGLLLFHGIHLALPGPKPAVRVALLGFVASVFSYVFCQQAELLLYLPRPVAYGLLVFCVGGAGWLWVAAKALFDDHFRWSWPVLASLGGLLAIGLAANLPYFPDGAGPFKTYADDAPVAWLGRLHAIALLGFSVAAVWEVARGWRDDLVEARRVARRWVALGIGLYAGLALVIELALHGHAVGRLLPALHILGIGMISLGLAVLVARRSLNEVLGIAAAESPQPAKAPDLPAPAREPVAEPAPPPDRQARWLARLNQAMVQDHAYRQEGLTLAALAQRLDMPEAALRELINQRLGHRNFNDFLHHHRLQEATQRLSREDLPILSIALECGYGSIGPFNRAFKQRTGVTPTEFRAAARLARPSPGA